VHNAKINTILLCELPKLHLPAHVPVLMCDCVGSSVLNIFQNNKFSSHWNDYVTSKRKLVNNGGVLYKFAFFLELIRRKEPTSLLLMAMNKYTRNYLSIFYYTFLYQDNKLI
jgi:hypothetical protein